MALYEHVFISRQDLTTLQTEDLIKQYSDILKENGGKVIGHQKTGVEKIMGNSQMILLAMMGPMSAGRMDAP